MSWFFTPRGNNGNNVNANSEGAMYVVDIAPSGTHYTVAAKTGTIAAAAAAGASVFAMRLNPGYAGKAYIGVLKVRFTCIVAFTTPVTQTRSIVMTRGAGAASSGGTAIATVAKKDTNYGNSNFESALGGDVRISTTGALTVTGITFETVNQGEMTLAHVGTAGAFSEHVWEWESRAHALELNPGELMAIRVGASAMDAAGTWSVGIEVQWREATSEG
jgi:hypothetical protein